MAENKGIPQYLMAMINANFITTKGGRKDDRGYFCVDCAGHTLTKAEKEAEHEGHRVFQPLKCSWVYGYRKEDICGLKDLDVSGVCAFSINNTEVYFPKSRKPNNNLKKNNGVIPGFCITCGWDLSKKPGLFCSILCKLNSSQGHQKSVSMESMMMQNEIFDLGRSLIPGDRKKKKICKEEKRCSIVLKIKIGSGIKKLEKNDEKLQSLISVIVEDDGKKLIPRKRSRKGIPRRAPFF